MNFEERLTLLFRAPDRTTWIHVAGNWYPAPPDLNAWAALGSVVYGRVAAGVVVHLHVVPEVRP